MRWLKHFFMTLMIFGIVFTACDCDDEKNPVGPDTGDPPPGDQPGQLIITSDPAGAEIWFNGENTGLVTPDTLTEIEEQENEVRLTLRNYFPFDSEIEVHAGETVTISPSLTQALPYKMAYNYYDTLFIVGLDGLDPQPLAYDFHRDIARIIWSSDGRYLAYFSKAYEIVILSAEGVEVARLPHDIGSRSWYFSWGNLNPVLVYGVYFDGIYRYDVLSGIHEKI